MSKVYEEIVNGKSVREALTEASLTFKPGSLAEGVFKLFKTVRDYYSKLIINEFQLYSNVYHHCLKTGQIDLVVNAKDYSVPSIQSLTQFNEQPFTNLTAIQFEFILSPDLKSLPQHAAYNPNHELFGKTHTFACPVGDGSFYAGDFKPSWNQVGLVVKSNCLRIDRDSNLIYGAPDSAAVKTASVPTQSMDQVNQYSSSLGYDSSSFWLQVANALASGTTGGE